MGVDGEVEAAGAPESAWSRQADWTVLQQFADVITHELRTPMAVVRLTAETLRSHLEDLDQEELRSLVEVIERHSRLASLLLARLTLAHVVQEDDVHLELEPVDLGHLTCEAVDDVEDVLLRDHPTQVRVADGLEVVGDPARLREIVLNLLSNAAQYSDAGDPIEVECERGAQDVRLIVRDHGPGVPSALAEGLFEQYAQGDPGSPGVGLGLFIARGLARAHGGDLTVCVDGDGAAFALRLPVAGPASRQEVVGRSP